MPRGGPDEAEGANATVDVRAVNEGRRLDSSVEIGFIERGSGAPAVLLLHGSPGSNSDVRRLALLLGNDYRTIAPDLPGFGRSQRDVPDYSIAAHADYAAQLLDHLEIRQVHLVGFSMGGGVALELARQGDERIRSLTLLASIGAQEFELFGDYHLNHAVHGAQLAALWAVHRLTPHFGLLDGVMLSIPYGRNFFDSDQRPLREALGALEVPTLILHGRRDFLVPVAAAREHFRLVPQSEIVLYPASGHLMPILEPGIFVRDLLSFLRRVDEGHAPTRAEATQERRAAAAQPFDPATLPEAVGATLLVWMLLLAVATLVSEDLTCIASGLLVAQGRLDFAAAALACGLGIFVGDVALFVAGRYLGRPWLRRAPLKWWLDERRLAQAAEWFHRRGVAVIFLSRFWPGMRLSTYVAAGLLRTSWSRFVVLFAVAVATLDSASRGRGGMARRALARNLPCGAGLARLGCAVGRRHGVAAHDRQAPGHAARKATLDCRVAQTAALGVLATLAHLSPGARLDPLARSAASRPHDVHGGQSVDA